MAFRASTLIIAAALAGTAYFAYQYFAASPDGQQGGGGAPPVSVAEVKEHDVRQWNEFSGRLVAVERAEIRPRVPGTIEEVHFKDGDLVTEGDLLFVIDPRPYVAALGSAQARATFAEAEFKRAEGLLKDKAIAQRDYDERKNAAQIARADLATAKLNLDYTQVKAPISGRVGRAEITEGNLVNIGEALLTTIVSSHPIYADFTVDEGTYLRYVQAGATGPRAKTIPVQMGLVTEEDTPHTGYINSFDNQLDTNSGTIRVRAVFDNENGGLVPGLFARIKLGTASGEKALLITDRAVGTDQSKKFVIVVAKDPVPPAEGADKSKHPEMYATEHREVKLGGLADGLRVVESGLKPGERIVVNGLQRIMMPGQPVMPQMVNMEDAETPPPAGPAPETKAEAPATQDATENTH